MIDEEGRKSYNFIGIGNVGHNMIQENFDIIYKRFRIELYRHIFSQLGKRECSLSATDFFSVETILLMGTPTITEFAKALCISQPNATYRVKSLIDKGVIEKMGTDKRTTFRLRVTDKFMKYYHDEMGFGNLVFEKLTAHFSEEELEQVDKIFEKFIAQLADSEG